MHLPTDDSPPSSIQHPASSIQPGNLIDAAPLIDPAQRETDFNRVFVWRGKEVSITLASELYYRELRVHGNAPALGSYDTQADFAPEAMRVLYCAHLTPEAIRNLRLMSAPVQLAAFDAWVAKNIEMHEINAATVIARDMNECVARARARVAETGDGVDGSGN